MKLRLIGTLTLMLVLVLGSTVLANDTREIAPQNVNVNAYENWEREPNDIFYEANFMISSDIGLNLGHIGRLYDQDFWFFHTTTQNNQFIILLPPAGQNYDLYVYEEDIPGWMLPVAQSTNPVPGGADFVSVPGSHPDGTQIGRAHV